MSEARRDHLARVLSDVLSDGEEYVVSRRDGQVEVVDPRLVLCREKHPRLYGHLLALNEQVLSSGGNLSVYSVLAAAIFCVGIHLQWWDDLLGPAVDHLRSVWFYIVCLVTVFLGVGTLVQQFEKLAYRRGRAELAGALLAEEIDRATLLAMIAGDPDLAKVSEFLRLDREFGG